MIYLLQLISFIPQMTSREERIAVLLKATTLTIGADSREQFSMNKAGS